MRAAGGLHGIEVEGDTACPRDGGEGRGILHRADLIVRITDRDERRVVAQRRREIFGAHPAAGVDGHERDLEAVETAEVVDGLQDRLVLDRARHDMARAAGERAERDALDREVVRLRAAGGEDDVARAHPDHVGDARAGIREGGGGGFSPPCGDSTGCRTSA